MMRLSGIERLRLLLSETEGKQQILNAKHKKEGGDDDYMGKPTNELTPATLENMPIGQKITAYEQILNDQSRLTEKLEDINKRGNAALEATGQTFSPHLQKAELRVSKKREVDPVIAVFAEHIGNNVSSIIAHGSASETTLEEYLGKECYAKLKAIADEYSVQGYGTKYTDLAASEKVWHEYTKIRKEYQDVRDQLDRTNRRMEHANQYVSYVQKLAEVASKTKRLMQ